MPPRLFGTGNFCSTLHFVPTDQMKAFLLERLADEGVEQQQVFELTLPALRGLFTLKA